MKTAGELVNFLRTVPPSTPVDINGRSYTVSGGKGGVHIMNAKPSKPQAKPGAKKETSKAKKDK